MAGARIIEADLTWTGEGFEPGVRIELRADGRIGSVGTTGPAATERLAGRALLPGFVNAHSHAFQRALRGHGETYPTGMGSFWTWREAMYGLVERLDAPTIREVSLRAFREMLAAGITTVGEFHYVHHDARCAGFAFDEVVLDAAREAGIRIALLNAYYRRGGFDTPLSPAQRRFETRSPGEYWEQMDRLAARLDGRTQSLGAVAHSLRAASLDDVAALHEESRRRGIVFHMHVEEQRREIEECVAAYGAAPMALLNDRLTIDERFTAVHCTHTDPLDMERFATAGGNVCLCPITEGNLGDGIADVPGMLDSGAGICIGTDLNARLSFTEELRWLEQVQRLDQERRGVVVDETGDVARALLRIGTSAGARALGIDAGRIETGAMADFAVVRLDDPSLAGWTPETLLGAFLFGGSDRSVDGVFVGGAWIAAAGGERVRRA